MCRTYGHLPLIPLYHDTLGLTSLPTAFMGELCLLCGFTAQATYCQGHGIAWLLLCLPLLTQYSV